MTVFLREQTLAGDKKVNNASRHSAAASLGGYLYQCRLALLETLKRLKTNPALRGLGTDAVSELFFI